MNVLVLSQRVPYPPQRGDKIRVYHEVRGLAERGHAVHLLAFSDTLQESLPPAALLELCATVTVARLNPRSAGMRALAQLAAGRGSMSLAYFRSAHMHRAVEAVLSSTPIGASLVCSSAMAQYIPEHLLENSVIDLVDVDSEKWHEYAHHFGGPRGLICMLEARRLQRYEQRLLCSAGSVVVTTHREATLLANASHQPYVITNGVDLEHFKPTPASAAASARLVFTGVMDYPPNVDGVQYFARQVLPRVRKQQPLVELVVVGSRPTAAVRRLASGPRVTVTGHVPDVRPYLADATVSIAPLRIARGVQNKVLEAMACGRAVVATPEAVAGLQVTTGEHVLIGSTSAGLAQATLHVLQDAELRARLGHAGRSYVEREHRWQPHMNRLVDLVEEVAA